MSEKNPQSGGLNIFLGAVGKISPLDFSMDLLVTNYWTYHLPLVSGPVVYQLVDFFWLVGVPSAFEHLAIVNQFINSALIPVSGLITLKNDKGAGNSYSCGLL